MKSRKRTVGILIVVIVVIVLLLGFAGSLLVYRNKLSEKTKTNSNNNTAQYISSAPSGKSIENFYDKPITDEKIALESIEANRDKLGYVDKNFTFIYDEKDGSETAYHFDLYYKGLPVHSPVGIRGVSVITHLDNSAKILITGVSNSEEIRKVNTTPEITQDKALDIAKETLGEKFSEYNIGVVFKQVKVNPRLIIYNYNDKYELAYYVRTVPYLCVINAENGEIIKCHSLLVSNTAEYEGQNGDIHQIFYDEYKDEENDIKDLLWNKDKNIFISDYPIRFMSLSDIQYGKNKSAVDAMANTYRAVEYFDSEFGVSFDNTMCIINVNGDCINNAKGIGADNEDGSFAFIYIGERTNKKKAQYSAYLDIVAHEYTHAVTDIKTFGSGYESDRKYFERNSLMEAYSDIFGQLIEQKYTGKTDWIQSVPDNSRDLKKTKTYSKRQKTKDDKGTEKNGYGYAHNNSTIISHTAFLMSKDNRNSKYNNDILLDYDQLGQLWYGSLEYLKKTEFKDFADCRYSVEESARKLIEDGVLLEDNLKVIEQAFNEVGVSSNPTRRGAIDSAEIKKKYNVEVPIEDETNSTEMVEIEEIENYEWYLEPKIEAEDIIVSDEYNNNNTDSMIDPYDECAIIKQNGKYGIIKYDGSYIAESKYNKYFCDGVIEMCVFNEYKNSAQNVVVFSSENELHIEVNYEYGRGNIEYKYIYDSSSEQIYCLNSVSTTAETYTENSCIIVECYDFDIIGEYDKENNQYKIKERYEKIDSSKPKYGIAKNGKLLVRCEYEDGCMNFSNGIIALKKDGKWGYFDDNGNQIIDFICESFPSKIIYGGWWKNSDNMQYPFLSSSGYIPIKINGQCGYYDTQGNEIIPCGTFEDIRPVHKGLAWVKTNGKWGVIKLKDIEVTTSSTELRETKEKNTNNFNISDYNGIFYPSDSNVNAYVIIEYQSEKYADIEVNITNKNATRVSQVIFSGNIEDILLTFEEDDGFGKNSYILELLDGKVYLTAECIESYGTWGIPNLNKVELTKPFK